MDPMDLRLRVDMTAEDLRLFLNEEISTFRFTQLCGGILTAIGVLLGKIAIDTGSTAAMVSGLFCFGGALVIFVITSHAINENNIALRILNEQVAANTFNIRLIPSIAGRLQLEAPLNP